MSDEIVFTIGLRVRKTISFTDDFKADIEQHRVVRTLTGSRKYANTQTIGTTYEAVSVGSDLATRGYAYFRNLSANYVEIGSEVNSSFAGRAKLFSGDFAIIPLSTDALFARANTAPVELDYLILEL